MPPSPIRPILMSDHLPSKLNTNTPPKSPVPGAASPKVTHIQQIIGNSTVEYKDYGNSRHNAYESMPLSHYRNEVQSPTPSTEMHHTKAEIALDFGFVEAKSENRQEEPNKLDHQEVITSESSVDLPKQTPGHRPFSWEPIPRPTEARQQFQSQSEARKETHCSQDGNEDASLSHDPERSSTMPGWNVDKDNADHVAKNQPQRVRLFEELQTLIQSLCFSDAFTDRIPGRPTWYSLGNGLRLARSLMSREQRRFHTQVEADMYRFCDFVRNDPLIPDFLPYQDNVALRWNLTKFIWRLIREHILEYDGDTSNKQFERKASEHIRSAVHPFTDRGSDQDYYVLCISEVVSRAVRLRSLLASSLWSWYEFRLPPNLDGTCVGDGSKEHVRYLSLDGKSRSGHREIYGVVYDPLVRHAWDPSGNISISVESPALVADYCPEEQRDQFYFLYEMNRS
ncbi:hypothetical protein BGZ63DRAFT_431043 [Mariannaea sp. PMI_226]|nr:hypothetical protein BGZ63DRAFT_431043 [Mariannaea sp. PMI_226]